MAGNWRVEAQRRSSVDEAGEIACVCPAVTTGFPPPRHPSREQEEFESLKKTSPGASSTPREMTQVNQSNPQHRNGMLTKYSNRRFIRCPCEARTSKVWQIMGWAHYLRERCGESLNASRGPGLTRARLYQLPTQLSLWVVHPWAWCAGIYASLNAMLYRCTGRWKDCYGFADPWIGDQLL
jgi:hypothetical protein